MLGPFLDNRRTVTLSLSAIVGAIWLRQVPFPGELPILLLVELRHPWVYQGIRTGYWIMAVTTPLLVITMMWAVGYIFLANVRGAGAASPPAAVRAPRRPATRCRWSSGEVHHPTRTEPSPTPQWLALPARGLFTGVAIVGAVGSGKTSACMYPYADQLLAFRSHDPDRRLSALVLEVKGDFCHKLRGIAARHGRADDYVEVGLESGIRYNPLHNDLEAYALAYGIASLLNNLFGHSDEPFWQQAYTNLVKFLILLHKVVDGYVTLFDVYASAISPERIQAKLDDGGYTRTAPSPYQKLSPLRLAARPCPHSAPE